MAEVQVTWLGDEDPSQQVISQYGHQFVKGQPTKVPEKDPYMGKFKDNQTFKVGSEKGEVVDSTEPEPVDPDAGTEKAELRRQLDAIGETYDGRANAETLRGKLAAALAKQAGK